MGLKKVISVGEIGNGVAKKVKEIGKVAPNIISHKDPRLLIWFANGEKRWESKTVLGNNIYHVHAKDTKIEKLASLNTLLEPKSYDEYHSRTWNYCTLGNGHNSEWWLNFISTLKNSGYNDVVSIEHGDRKISNEAGLSKAINLLKKLI